MADRRQSPGVASLDIKVIAGASQTAIAGWTGNRLRVRIGVPAERGKANAALIALIAKSLDLPRSAIRLASGATSARKTLEITGLSRAAIVERLGKPDGK
jgi:hypothetical protein